MEYAPFLQARRGGVRGHDSRFAFEHYFAGPSTHDHALESYLRSLMRSAAGDKRIPVMKFCRSLGRVAWMQAHFPDVLHAVILRNPEAQWRSARRQMEHNKNRYFVLAPFIILARNARHPLLAEAADRLEVRMPPRLSGDLGITTAACWRHVQLLDWRQRFRGFLALWLASGMAALDSSALVIDADRLGAEPQHRRMAERAIGEAAGLSADFTPNAQDDGAAPGTASEQQDAACAKAAAFDMLRGHAGMLAPERAAVLATKLSAEGAVTPEAPGRQPARAHQPGVLRHVDAAAYVTLARASYPLRRAHYHVRRWLSLA
jgi:hypothetical protein